MRKYLFAGMFVALLAFSAPIPAPAADYFIIEDKNGVCRVIKARGWTRKSIDGPFTTKREAMRVKARICPKRR